MRTKRLEAICSFLTKEDKLIDIGCDHAYVCLEMAKRKAPKILATDIHPGALEIAQKNIATANMSDKITCQLSDGLKEIASEFYDTLVIAGMGASTIKHILSNQEKLKTIEKIIIQSNNELDQVRKFMNDLGYFLKEEKVVYEKKHYYVIMNYQKGTKKQSKKEIAFGLYQKENQDYYKYLKNKYQEIIQTIPFRHGWKRLKLKRKIRILSKYLNRIN